MGRSDQSSRRQDLLTQEASDRCPELPDGDAALELRLDPPVAADQERPGLSGKMPLADPTILPVARIIAFVDLHVDEPEVRSGEAPSHPVDHVDNRTARPAGR